MILGKLFVDVTEYALNIEDGYSYVFGKKQGAISAFFGVVREYNLGRRVIQIDYDVYKSMALKTFRAICQENIEQHGNMFNQYVIHFSGILPVGELSVGVVVSSPHRKEAFIASQYIIDNLKHRAPIWKKEYYEDGETEWVQGHSLCKNSNRIL